ncbi:hypothetical protein [Shiella aurantiaca]|nr:hypothetical protein [Shiella aurantiaca]
MKTIHKIQLALMAILLMVANATFAQQPDLQYFRPNDKNGLNVI